MPCCFRLQFRCTPFASGTGMLKASAGSSRSTALANARPAGLLKPASYLILMHPAAFSAQNHLTEKQLHLLCHRGSCGCKPHISLTFDFNSPSFLQIRQQLISSKARQDRKINFSCFRLDICNMEVETAAQRKTSLSPWLCPPRFCPGRPASPKHFGAIHAKKRQ